MGSILIFDYDGVIVDSLDLFMDYFIQACKQEGFEEIGSKQVFLSLFDGNMFEKMLEKGMSREQIKRIMYFMRDELVLNQEKLQVFPGMRQVLKTLSSNNSLYIITSNESHVVNQFLSLHQLTMFKNIIGSEKEPSKVKKIQMIIEQNGHNNVFYIGDTVGDILEGKKAKVDTVAVSWGWHDLQKLRKIDPSYLVSRPEDLIHLFP
ncbi:MAG: HAD-IA family hydrolase [Candidatus Thermoplasmatota archaeon]|nr:HAD-IA family hydrolase [Candidatus Thermoplasmatota archaeon]